MPKAFLRDLRVDPSLEQLGCVRMPEIVKPYPWEIGILDKAGKSTREGIRIRWT